MDFPDSDSPVIMLSKKFSGDMVSAVRNELDELLREETGFSEIILDFSVTELIDSNGVGTMVSYAREFEARQIKLKLKNLSEELLQFFRDTGLDRVFTIQLEKAVVPAAVSLLDPVIDIRMQIGKEFINDYAIFHLSGLMHHPVESSYFKQQFLLLLTRCNKLILDMNNLEFIDSLSISSILSMNNLLTGTGGSLLICQPNFFVHDLLDTLSIDSIIPIYSSLEEACAHWEKKDE